MLLFSRFHAMNLHLYGVFPSYFRGQKRGKLSPVLSIALT
jgi:hypothetical protein